MVKNSKIFYDFLTLEKDDDSQTDEEGYALLKAFGLPFKNAKND